MIYQVKELIGPSGHHTRLLGESGDRDLALGFKKRVEKDRILHGPFFIMERHGHWFGEVMIDLQSDGQLSSNRYNILVDKAATGFYPDSVVGKERPSEPRSTDGSADH